jgi:hypothetical protein
MKGLRTRLPSSLSAVLVLFAAVFGMTYARAQDPLPSWNDGPAKHSILVFVKDTTEKSSPKYVEPADRIATFDQDGTLWTEHPLYAQGMFALARVQRWSRNILNGNRRNLSNQYSRVATPR